MDRERENQLTEIASRWEAICQVLEDGEVSDFMMSFPEVRRVWNLMHGGFKRGYKQALDDCGIAYGKDAERFLANMAEVDAEAEKRRKG